MKRSGAVCPECGSTATPHKEKIMGQDTQDLICADCDHIGWWASFQPENQKKKEENKGES